MTAHGFHDIENAWRPQLQCGPDCELHTWPPRKPAWLDLRSEYTADDIEAQGPDVQLDATWKQLEGLEPGDGVGVTSVDGCVFIGEVAGFAESFEIRPWVRVTLS